ncbi:MAG: hypothetical protein NT084_10635 [Bacteroidetes bacterium]|nr:hypothetical protein [Bacteroidota bacterium]
MLSERRWRFDKCKTTFLQDIEAIDSSLDVLIKDPAEPVLTNNQPTVAPSGITTWVTTQNNLSHDSQIISNDVNVLSNMLQNGNPCIPTIMSPLTPIQMGNEITFQNDLLPLKLYTAIYNSRYKRVVTDTKTFVKEVHRYVFQTSRYGNFAEQINSYILRSHIDTNTSQLVIDKAAIFNVDQAFDNATQIAIATQFVTDPNTVSDSLIQQFSHPYDRLVDGILKIRSTNSPNQSLEPAVTNEFNFIKNTNTGNIIGVLVRCPEPFNDPKIPSAVLQTTLSLNVTIGNLNIPGFTVFFSKDNSKAFITNDDASLNMPVNGNYAFTFTYKQFDGNQYSTVGSAITVVINR